MELRSVTHFVSSSQEAWIILKGLFHQSTEAVKQGEQLLHVFLWVLQQRPDGATTHWDQDKSSDLH